MGKEKKSNSHIDPSYVQMYFNHQYDRIGKHEDRAINISNIVLTISALVITFGLNNRDAFGSIFIFFLPTVLVIANIFAILYVKASEKWIQSHRARAKHVLKDYAEKLYIIDKDTMKYTRFGRRKFQYAFHGTLLFIAIILIILFCLELMGIAI